MIVGIDLGTTNSLIAFFDSGEAKVIPNALGELLTPSVISVDEDGTILIGKSALCHMANSPEKGIANFKRYMGSERLFKLGDYQFRPEELSALVLRRLKEDAEAYLGCEIEEAIISVPAYFSDSQRKATKNAGKLAGLKVERLINEPTAAGIAYGLQGETDDINYLVFDLGGGTFDVSILMQFSGVIEVRASSGDNLLGGIDFTAILGKEIENQIIGHLKIKDPIPLLLQQRINEQAEIAKHILSVDQEAHIKLNYENQILECVVTKKEFEQRTELLLDRIKKVVQKVLIDSNLSANQIAKIVLVGGASRMPLIKNLVAKMFGKFPLIHIDPDTVVVRGAAIQAAFKQNNKALEEFVVTDVSPFSLGVAVAKPKEQGGFTEHFDPIIERNTVIPASRSRVYYPVQPDQRRIDIRIYQGEDFFIEKNIFLGTLTVNFETRLKDPGVEIRFTYDINGLLEVEALILETKEKVSLIIEGNPGLLSDQEMNHRLNELKKLKLHPRDQTENILLIKQAERLYADLQGDKRANLGNAITQFINILDSQDSIRIARARKQLEEILITLQPEHSLV